MRHQPLPAFTALTALQGRLARVSLCVAHIHLSNGQQQVPGQDAGKPCSRLGVNAHHVREGAPRDVLTAATAAATAAALDLAAAALLLLLLLLELPQFGLLRVRGTAPVARKSRQAAAKDTIPM